MNLALLLLLGTLWGSSHLFIKVTVAEVPALTLVAGRLALAAVTMWMLLRTRGIAMPRGRRVWSLYGVMGLLNMAVPYSLISWGQQYIPSGLGALLVATMPIFTVILTYLLASDERISVAKLAGVVVGFVGVGILMYPDLRQGQQANALGQLAVASASFSYAGAIIFARSRLRGQPPLTSATGQMTMGVVFVMPASLLIDRPFDLSPSPAALASWVGLTLLGTVVAYVLYYILIEQTSATFVSMVAYVIPVSGLFLGALVLNEPLGVTVLASLALLLLGVLLVRE
jgi:drug/metabolite transporter (DMT)-like permease